MTMLAGQTFTPRSYEEAWQTIKRIEHCSTADAMRLAQDRFPKLYQQFLDTCARGKV